MNKKFSLKSVIALMLLASALTCTILAFLIFTALGFDMGLVAEIKDYAELRAHMDGLYIGEYDADALQYDVFSTAVSSLGDTWSYYMSEEQYENYLNYSNNTYAGIGVRIRDDAETGGIEIVSVTEGGPAEQAGISAGEIILAVDGIEISDFGENGFRDYIRSKNGERIELSMLGTGGNVREVSLVCKLIYTNPVSFEMLEGDIGYVAVKNFESTAAEGFKSAVESLSAEGAVGFIFDVRNNGGGKVSQLTEMLDYLLPEGEIFVSVAKNGRETVSKSGTSCVEAPMAVLVNRNTYSAAEFFAAVLREYDWAETVGERTSGKGRSQVTIGLSGGGALHISSKEYVTPNRISLYAEQGIAPDYDVSISDEEFSAVFYGTLDKEDDTQLQAAVEALKK